MADSTLGERGGLGGGRQKGKNLGQLQYSKQKVENSIYYFPCLFNFNSKNLHICCDGLLSFSYCNFRGKEQLIIGFE